MKFRIGCSPLLMEMSGETGSDLPDEMPELMDDLDQENL